MRPIWGRPYSTYEPRKSNGEVQQPKHWRKGCMLCASYFITRVSMNIIAAAARGIGPLFWAFVLAAFVSVAGHMAMQYYLLK